MSHVPSSSNGAPIGGLTLPPELLDAIGREARARRRRPEALVREWLEDLADARAAEKSRKASAGKPNIPLSQLKIELGL